MKTKHQNSEISLSKPFAILKYWHQNHYTKINSSHKDRLFFVFNICFWLTLSLFTFLKVGIFKSLDKDVVYWYHIFSYTFTSGVLWIPITGLAWWIAKAFPFQKHQLLRFIILHICLALILSSVQRISSMSLDYLIQTNIIKLDSFPSYSEYLSRHFARRWVEGILWYMFITVAVYSYHQLRRKPSENEKDAKTEYITIKKKGTQFRICVDDILFIESKRNYCSIHTAQTVYKKRISLKMLEQELAASTIKRIHNSFMINTAQVFGIQHIQNGEYLFSIRGTIKRISSTKTYREKAKEIIVSIENNF